jgi:hypothetical protein
MLAGRRGNEVEHSIPDLVEAVDPLLSPVREKFFWDFQHQHPHDAGP